MSIPEYLRYPGPISRPGSNNFWESRKPGGGLYSRIWQGHRVHGGDDLKPSIAGRTGELILSPFGAGIVVFAEPWTSRKTGTWGDEYGNRVLVKHHSKHRHGTVSHEHDWWMFYAHLLNIRVAVGAKILSPGIVIGTLGRSGNKGLNTFPAHCHHEGHTDPRWAYGLVDIGPRAERRRQIELAA